MLAASLLSGCGIYKKPNTMTMPPQPQLVNAPVALYSKEETMAMSKALVSYIQENAEALAKYRPVVVGGTVLQPGTLFGQSYNPGTALLRQLGYLSFHAPGVQAWMDPAPAGCIQGLCTFTAYLVTSQGKYLIPVEWAK